MGKVVLWLAQELVKMGHQVLVTCLGAPTATLYSKYIVYNPKRQCSPKSRLCDYLQDVDIPTAFAKRGMLIQDAIEILGKLDAVITFGSHHAGALGEWINSEVFTTWTRLGKPAVAYMQIDTPYERLGTALSVASYSVATYPSEFSRSVAVKAVKLFMGEKIAEKFSMYTAVAYHGIDTNIYNEKVAKIFAQDREPRDYKIIGFVSKNHPRKDFGALVRCVAKLRKKGFNVVPGAYMIEAVGVPVWNDQNLTDFAKLIEGIPINVLVLPQPLRSIGLTEYELIEFYVKWMDIHAYLSRGESFGMPSLESVMLGVPTAVSDIPPQREIWQDTLPMIRTREVLIDNWVALSPDPEHCAEICETILTKGQDLSRARERVLSMFTARHMAQYLLKAVEKAFEDPAPIALKVPEIGRAVGLVQ
ncbi:MAG: glycosyltransferase family 4 protein [Ignisphaera sp.]|nr:glycosyltransferase family 4 protein [Ignisphaera sp.]